MWCHRFKPRLTHAPCWLVVWVHLGYGGSENRSLDSCHAMTKHNNNKPLSKHDNSMLKPYIIIPRVIKNALVSILDIFDLFWTSFFSLSFIEYDRNFRLILEKHMIVVKLAQSRCFGGIWRCWIHLYIQKHDLNT